MTKAINRLSEEQLHTVPSPSVQSIPSILRHIEDNVKIRVRNSILQEELLVDRRGLEHNLIYRSKDTLDGEAKAEELIPGIMPL